MLAQNDGGSVASHGRRIYTEMVNDEGQIMGGEKHEATSLVLKVMHILLTLCN